MEKYKSKTKQLYEEYAYKFEELTRKYTKKFIQKEPDLFVKSLNRKSVLELGSGTGRDSLIFIEKGLNPLCADISLKMAELCRKRGLKAEIVEL